MKKRSFFGINPTDELDLKHQGSVGGDQLTSRIGRNIEESKSSSLKQPSQGDFTPGREPAEGPDVAMKSPSHERWQQKTPDRQPTEGQKLEQEQKLEQPKSGKLHHYK